MVTYIGDNGPDKIIGTNANDTIRGKGGNDDLYGKDGADRLFGDSGDDYLSGGEGNDYLEGGAGVNVYLGFNGYDRFVMSSRNVGFTDDTILDFKSRVDVIDLRAWGISSFDQVREISTETNKGDLVLKADYDGYGHLLQIKNRDLSDLNTRDFIFQNPRNLDDTGTRFDDVMFGSRFNDKLKGDDGNDDLLGGGGNDRLFGGTGNDHLIGGKGNDVLTGGRGRDVLQGDAGNDIFRFINTKDSAVGATHDLIIDFLRDADRIDLSRIDADTTQAGNQAFEFVGSSIFTGVGQLIYSEVDGNTVIVGNTDADTAAEFEIWISGIFTPRDSDFIL